MQSVVQLSARKQAKGKKKSTKRVYSGGLGSEKNYPKT